MRWHTVLILKTKFAVRKLRRKPDFGAAVAVSVPTRGFLTTHAELASRSSASLSIALVQSAGSGIEWLGG